MSIFNTNSIGPEKFEPCITRKVFFTGSTAVKKGQALVWDLAPSSGQPAVGQCVRAPSSTYKYHFAGVALKAYAANSAGQWIDIALPGSVCHCLVGPATTAGSTTVVFAQNGLFGLRSTTSIAVSTSTATISAWQEEGCGTAVALETNGTAAEAGVLLKCLLLDGTDAVAPSYSYSA